MSRCAEVVVKVCSGCGRERPAEHFRRHNRSRDGLGRLCADCRLRRRYEKERRMYSGSLPPYEQWRKNRYENLGRGRFARRNLTVRQLERLHARGVISERQMEAGLLYRKAYELSGIPPRLVSSYGLGSGAGECTYGMPATERQAHWRHVLRNANRVMGQGMASIAEAVAVHDATIGDIALMIAGGSRFAASRDRAVDALRGALDTLARYFMLR